MLFLMLWLLVGVCLYFWESPMFQFYLRTSPENMLSDEIWQLKMTISIFWPLMFPMYLVMILVEKIRGDK